MREKRDDAQDRALTLVVTIAIGRLPPPVVAATPEQAPFDETWRESAVTVALKSAALARIEEPKIVQTETVKVEPAVVTLPDSPEKQPVAKRKPKRHVERDVCPGVRSRNEKGVVLELRGAKGRGLRQFGLNNHHDEIMLGQQRRRAKRGGGLAL